MKKSILLADDDESVRKMVGRVLESENYRVFQAKTGREAIAKSFAEAPDLILLDLSMPGKDGWEVFCSITSAFPFVPVIVITARLNEYENAVKLGIDALMEKPLDLPLLLKTIRDLLAEPERQRIDRLTDREFKPAYLTKVGDPQRQPALRTRDCSTAGR